MQKAVFLDRDGVLNKMVWHSEFGIVDSPCNPDELEIIPEAEQALKILRDLGYLLFLISNQPIIAKGKVTKELFNQIDSKFQNWFKEKGIEFDKVYYCLHHPDANQVKNTQYLAECDCRKPKPGMILQAQKEFDIDLANSFVIGDGITDIQAGKTAGCKTIFIGEVKCEHCNKFQEKNINPDYIAKDLLSAAQIIKTII